MRESVIGDGYNMNCPNCWWNNCYICQGPTVVFVGGEASFSKQCGGKCKKIIYYHAMRRKNLKDKDGFPKTLVVAFSENPEA